MDILIFSSTATVTRIVDTVESKVTDAKNQFDFIKENVINTFSGAVESVKEKGVSVLKNTVDFLKIQSVLSGLKGKLNQAVTSLHNGISRIEGMKGEIHAAKIHAQNAGRAITGKDAKEILAPHADRGVLTGIQKLLTKTGGLLSGIGKAADSAINKLEKLEQKDEKMSVRESLKTIKHSRNDASSSKEKVSSDKTR